MGDDGATVIIARVGPTELDLPDTEQWGDPIVDTDAVTLSIISSFAPTGTRMWSVDPQGLGTATVRVPRAGGPAFTVTIDVRP